MKYVLFLAVIVLIQMMRVECRKKDLRECMKELEITKDMIKEYREKKTEIPETKCLAACLMKKRGYLEEGNKYNMEKFKNFATKRFPEKAEEYVKGKQECVDAAKSLTNECEFAKSVEDCTNEKFPDMPKRPKPSA